MKDRPGADFAANRHLALMGLDNAVRQRRDRNGSATSAHGSVFRRLDRRCRTGCSDHSPPHVARAHVVVGGRIRGANHRTVVMDLAIHVFPHTGCRY